MSPNVGNFVHDLVEMAKAMETLPQVQAENERLTHSLDDALRTVQDRELAIVDYKSLIDSLNSRIRSLEVERDDASFRVLEAEDTSNAVLVKARGIQATLEGMIAKLDPPKPEPELQPQAVSTQDVHGSLPEPKAETFTGFEPQGSSESLPTSQNSDTQQLYGVSTERSSTYGEEASKSDANPTQTSASEMGNQSGSVEVATSEIIGSSVTKQDTVQDQSKGPYFDKRYHDMPDYISLHDWLDGGGSELNYYWRPSATATGSF